MSEQNEECGLCMVAGIKVCPSSCSCDCHISPSLPPAINRKSLASKLSEVMASFDYVEKRGKNEQQNYRFVRAADLAHLIRKELAARNVVMIADVVEAREWIYESAKGSKMFGIHLKVKYTFIDGDSGEQLSFHGWGTGVDTGDKAAYKAHTGALKYALRTAFLVPDESDPEADSAADPTDGANIKSGGHLVLGMLKQFQMLEIGATLQVENTHAWMDPIMAYSFEQVISAMPEDRRHLVIRVKQEQGTKNKFWRVIDILKIGKENPPPAEKANEPDMSPPLDFGETKGKRK